MCRAHELTQLDRAPTLSVSFHRFGHWHELRDIFADVPSDDDSLWEQLDPAAREAAIDRLAQAIAKVVTDNHPGLRENNDE